MDVAAMNIRIRFQKNAVVTDKIGNHINSWTDHFSCFATLSDSTGKSNSENETVGLTVDASEISFTVRYCNETMAITSTGYRVLWNGEAYNILKIDHLNMKKQALKFKCKKVRS